MIALLVTIYMAQVYFWIQSKPENYYNVYPQDLLIALVPGLPVILVIWAIFTEE